MLLVQYSRSSNMNQSNEDNSQVEPSITTTVAQIVISGSNLKPGHIQPPSPVVKRQASSKHQHQRRTSSDSVSSNSESVASSSGSSTSSVNKPVKSPKPTEAGVRRSQISSAQHSLSKGQSAKEQASPKGKDVTKHKSDKADKADKPKKDKSSYGKVKSEKATGDKVKGEKGAGDKAKKEKVSGDNAKSEKPSGERVKSERVSIDKPKVEKSVGDALKLERVRSSIDRGAVPSPTAAASPQHAKRGASTADVDKHVSPSPKASGTPQHPSKDSKDPKISRSRSSKELHITQPSQPHRSSTVLSPTSAASPKTKQSSSSSSNKAGGTTKESTSQPGTPVKDSLSFKNRSQPNTPTKAQEPSPQAPEPKETSGDVTITIPNKSHQDPPPLIKQDSAEASTTLGLTQTFMTTKDVESGLAQQTSAELQANALALDQHVKRFGQGPIRAAALPEQLKPPALVRRADQRPRPRTFDDASVCSLEFTITSMSDADMSMPGRSKRHRRKHSHSTVLAATLEGAAPLQSARERRSRRNPKQPAMPSFNPGNERMAQFFAPSVIDDDESFAHTMSTMEGFIMGTHTEGLYGPGLSTIQTMPFVEQATQLQTVWEPHKPTLSKNKLRRIFPLHRVNWHAFRFWHVLWVMYIPLGLAILLLRLIIISLMLFCFGSSTGDGNSMISHFLFLAGIGTRVRFQWEKAGHSGGPDKVEKFWEAVGKESSVVFAMEHHGSPIEMLGFLDIVPLQLVSGAGRRLLGSLIGPTVYYGHGQSGRSPSMTELKRNPSISKQSQGRMAAVPSVRREDSTNKATATRALIVCPQGVPSSTHTVINYVGDVFQAKDTIHPVAVDHLLPLPLNPCTLNSSRWSDLVWMLFQPWQVVEYTILEPAPAGLSTDSVAKWCQQQVVKYSRMPKKLMDVSHEDWEWLMDNVHSNVA